MTRLTSNLHFTFALVLLLLVHAAWAQYEPVTTDYTKADSIAGLYLHYPLNNLRDLSRKLTAPLSTEEEKFRAIFTWVSNNIENDFQFYVLNKRKREKLRHDPEGLEAWNQDFRKRVFEKLLKEHKTVCTGYAYLVKDLAYHAGLKAEIVDGYGRTAQANVRGEGIANHQWNVVQIRGRWYLLDATWASGAIDTEVHRFVKRFNDQYFCQIQQCLSGIITRWIQP